MIEVQHLTKRYGRVTAVDDVSFRVEPGEILGFLGPNGAGKTTTLRMCAGLLEPDSGEIRVDGCLLGREPLEARRKLGFVPDDPFLYERLSAREFLDFIGAIYDVPAALTHERSERLLERFELADAGDTLIETYSLGMRQKVSVIAATLHHPRLLMLDEPLGGLDPHGARMLKDLLREHADGGGGVLVSTHLLDVAERLCDRVVILHHGVTRASGTLAELRDT
ncbi:MAG TPA: ABC transporter ATP-binding protein, partial [Vicinamibacterales bacterium]|nr:ABC transporter ATP-binding protein [Vicinamibacterales bacterium]